MDAARLDGSPSLEENPVLRDGFPSNAGLSVLAPISELRDGFPRVAGTEGVP